MIGWNNYKNRNETRYEKDNMSDDAPACLLATTAAASVAPTHYKGTRQQHTSFLLCIYPKRKKNETAHTVQHLRIGKMPRNHVMHNNIAPSSAIHLLTAAVKPTKKLPALQEGDILHQRCAASGAMHHPPRRFFFFPSYQDVLFISPNSQ